MLAPNWVSEDIFQMLKRKTFYVAIAEREKLHVERSWFANLFDNEPFETTDN